ncbi:MAG TPA: DUF4112 domain-containing protein [Caulobacteraceae bacterium]|nr:DUF4112 domain-containing protein [Caulobacteraceae bacterium]
MEQIRDLAERSRAHEAWLRAERIKQVSDRLVALGPFGVGLDGLLAFVPVAGGLYSLAAGGWLLFEGVKARAHPWTLLRMAAYVGFNTASAEVPIIGQTFDFFFRGHLMAANALQKDLARRHGAPDAAAIEDARRRPFARPAAPVVAV